ncbi:MAG: integrase [Alteromonadaceae bacterium]|nr:MAG: integrase [Alteromonadaceae bacterium]
MANPKPLPLFPTFDELKDMQLGEYPELQSFLAEGSRMRDWQWGQEFLHYIGRNKSEHTYIRFRNEVERFLLWSFLVYEKPFDEYRKADILEYADFCWQPPQSWISFHNADRFICHGGAYHMNKEWFPFRLKVPKNQSNANTDKSEPNKKKYRPSQQTLKAIFTALNAFYRHLMNSELCQSNPVMLAKNDCRHFLADAQVKEVRRLTEEQWQYVLGVAQTMADEDHSFERSLFVVASLKVLFLRISELSERKDWAPEMSHFWQDEDNNWWLKIFGKGRKLRDVTVPPPYIAYLKRYRKFRGQSGLPYVGDNSPLVEKLRGQGGMTARHLSRLVQQIFDAAHEKMALERGEDHARKLQQASTHWLRHTGASMEIERGRALKDLSEDLGHASMATTDTIYVQSENRRRAASGKGRKV